MNRNCNSEQLVSFKPCRLVFVGTDVPNPPEQKVEGAAIEAPKTPEEKRQQLADGIQKIEQRLTDFQKKADERAQDKMFQSVLSARKLDMKAGLKEIADKIAAIKTAMEKPDDAERNKAVLTEVQKVLGSLEEVVEDSDFLN